jgi:hypothetical protein
MSRFGRCYVRPRAGQLLEQGGLSCTGFAHQDQRPTHHLLRPDQDTLLVGSILSTVKELALRHHVCPATAHRTIAVLVREQLVALKTVARVQIPSGLHRLTRPFHMKRSGLLFVAWICAIARVGIANRHAVVFAGRLRGCLRAAQAVLLWRPAGGFRCLQPVVFSGVAGGFVAGSGLGFLHCVGEVLRRLKVGRLLVMW